MSARLFAALLSAELDWLVTVEPHLHRIASLGDVYDIPAKAIHAAPLLADWISRSVEDPIIIGPDEESRPWVAAVADKLDAPFAVAQKTRLGDRDVRIDLPDLSDAGNRTPVVIDDVVSSGQTLLELTSLLHMRLETRPVCAVVHGLFAGDAYAHLAAKFSVVVSTNTVKHDSNAIDVSSEITAAVLELC